MASLLYLAHVAFHPCSRVHVYTRSLPECFLRLLREEDRKAKSEEEGVSQAVDPDLPVRRMALRGLGGLLLQGEPVQCIAVLSFPDCATIILGILANSDLDLRRRAASVLAALVEAERCDALWKSVVASDEVAMAADQLLRGVCDADEEVSEPSARVLQALRSYEELKKSLAGEQDVITQLEAEAEAAEAPHAARLREIIGWLREG